MPTALCLRWHPAATQKSVGPAIVFPGGVSERPKEHASKACEGATPPWVQIPPPPQQRPGGVPAGYRPQRRLQGCIDGRTPRQRTSQRASCWRTPGVLGVHGECDVPAPAPGVPAERCRVSRRRREDAKGPAARAVRTCPPFVRSAVRAVRTSLATDRKRSWSRLLQKRPHRFAAFVVRAGAPLVGQRGDDAEPATAWVAAVGLLDRGQMW